MSSLSSIVRILLLILCFGLTISVHAQQLQTGSNRTRFCYFFTLGERDTLQYIIVSVDCSGYDGEKKMPAIDLYIGVNFWSSLKCTNASKEIKMEFIKMVDSDRINICFVHKGGPPRISEWGSAPLNSSLYNAGFGSSASLFGESAILSLFQRWDIGAPGYIIKDIYQRTWYSYSSSSWRSVITSSPVSVESNGFITAPSVVMRTAASPRNRSGPLEFSWTPDNPNEEFFVYLYFAELVKLKKTQIRKFDVCWNGSPLLESIVPPYLHAIVLTHPKPLVASEHRISLYKTKDSALPPILNAVEIYSLRQLNMLPTFEQDVGSMMEIKEKYMVERNWVGDPCEPKKFTWEGLKCNYKTPFPPQVISLNLSSSNLSGIITPAISNLSSLESLDLSNNNLTGAVPSFLAELSSLKYLNLKGNRLSGYVPTTLLERRRAGLLTLWVDNENINDSNRSNKKNKKNIIFLVAVSMSSILVLLIVFIIYWKHRRNEQSDEEDKVNEGGTTVRSKNWKYTYAEILNITSNFETVIGKGGFGTVYSGQMRDGNQVAVKLLSKPSSQGTRQFQTEVELLMTVHHKNLVSFIGYCDDDNWKAIIYEYMPNGNLRNYLSDTDSHNLSWEKRIQIAIDAAEGLNYLHQGCEPPIIHRDVKTTNILLNKDLEAKIADFGLSKMFKNDNQIAETSIIRSDTGHPVGTVGYIDPEYFQFMNLSEKSDIYSFGVVILELITGRPAILKGHPAIHILDWIKPEVGAQDLSRILDPTLQGNFDPTSAWKAIDIAMTCTASNSVDRPPMNVVLADLKQCFRIESPHHNEVSEPPRHMYSEIPRSFSEMYSVDSDSITHVYPR